MIRGVVLFALLGISWASHSANLYFDNILRFSLPNVTSSNGLNPAPLPFFSVRIGARDVYGSQLEANFIDGFATGFEAVKRKSDCQGPRSNGRETIINCTLSIQRLITTYKVKIQNSNQVFKNAAHFNETLVDVTISGRTPTYMGAVKRFQVVKMGLVNPTFTELSTVYSKYRKVLQDAYMTNVSTFIMNILQKQFLLALGQALVTKPMARS